MLLITFRAKRLTLEPWNLGKLRRITVHDRRQPNLNETKRKTMQLVIEKLLNDFERGGLTRRQLASALAALVSGAAQAAPKEEGLKAVTLNHVTVRVPDVHKTSQFYQEVFGMPLKQHSETTHLLGAAKSFFVIEQKGSAPALDHYDFGIAAF